ncbi:UDP-glucose 4-epimerase GalE [Sulfoacidibacillus thermotolerans]|uniref:UDP-glucose 4-epimerase n=1 Tax=Sulfoacidibacillus thermotolerans TaxID=1765684 RepID=A0A2U3DB30_SULT2|nr:UDP-glucose 4-epimerase GalE [Sulfoacidibacillus thermotolerans]PWI58488.1 UDP-glucose 4-epimerase GalE [Sulfoacidibacillus thermotolerans]
MAVLVTGGAGYIGSHTVAELNEHGFEVIVLDHLLNGHRQALFGTTLYEGDIADHKLIAEIIKKHAIDTVVHFAAMSLVGESVQKPLDYYEANVCKTRALLQTLAELGVQRFVFSSTAAVYGEPVQVPISEQHQTSPTNPYGDTKLSIEHMLRWCYNAYGMHSISLRYFNAAGAHLTLPIGEDHRPETHLIPLVVQAALGQREHVTVFGEDYETRDGTCVRDYVHVMDLASAHRLAVERLRHQQGVDVFNLGNGKGFSVKEVIDVVSRVTGRTVPTIYGARRAGDPAVLVASSAKAKEQLNWVLRHSDLETIVSSAVNWHSRHPGGFNE